MKIAVDAMGADYGPGPVIEGVVMALSDYPEDEFVLVGHSGKLPFYLETPNEIEGYRREIALLRSLYREEQGENKG